MVRHFPHASIPVESTHTYDDPSIPDTAAQLGMNALILSVAVQPQLLRSSSIIRVYVIADHLVVCTSSGVPVDGDSLLSDPLSIGEGNSGWLK